MAIFTGKRSTALFFIMPQLLVTVLFFIWPALGAVVQSLYYSDAFGLHNKFAGLGNYLDLLHSPQYINALTVTFIIAFSVTFLTMALGLLFAALVNSRGRSKGVYKTLLLWPYAVAPAVAAILWRFLCHPTLGWLTAFLHWFGIDFNYITNAHQALMVVILSATWQQFSYNFLFYMAALKLIPKTMIEAAILDGDSYMGRFWRIIFPLLSPTTFFLLVMNMVYAFFDTFGIIQVLTNGGPEYSTSTLIYKVYEDGFVGMDPGSSSAQSVILMLIVIVLTMLQFKFIENRVHYQ